MTDKQIIIDGVDVKDCKRRIGKDNFCRYYKRPCTENNYNCIWKKYLRKEQECEFSNLRIIQLQETLSQYETDLSTTDCIAETLKAQNKKLKAENDNWQKEYWELEQGNDFLAEKCSLYKQTLTEIKEIAEKTINSSDCYERMYGGMCARPILQKISEVEDEK